MSTPFHVRWAPKGAREEAAAPSEEETRFRELLRELFQFDCADLDFGIYRIMNHKREVIDRYINRELPEAIEEAVRQGAIDTEATRADTFAEVLSNVREVFGEDAIAPSGELLAQYQGTPLGKKYVLWRARAQHAESAADVRRDIFNHLYAFFSRYYQDGDFVPKRRYSWEHPYIVPYNGEEVHFHWVNRDQYYVKAAEHFSDYRYRTRSGVSVRFSVRSAHVEQNDVKGETRFFFPRMDEAVWDANRRTLEVPFDHRLPTGAESKGLKKNTQQKIILERAEAAVPEVLAASPEAATALLDSWNGQTDDPEASSLFIRHAERFARIRTSDFFIHRDLEAFLVRELDYYLRSEVLGFRSLVAGGEVRADAWLDKVRIIREVGTNLVEFLAQIEGFQKMLWEKRKFVVDVQYCVAARLIPDELRLRVLDCEAQWDEWRAQGYVAVDDDLFAGGGGTEGRHEFLKRNPGLLLDTRHFDSGFVDDLLATLDDIDEATDGLAIKSENWQALNLLEERYTTSLAATYIDPPYNAQSSEIIYKNTYRHSSWLALMENRIALAGQLMRSDAVVVAAIDEVEQEVLGQLLSRLYPDHEKICVTVVHNATGQQGSNFSCTNEFAYFIFPKSGTYIGLQTREEPDVRPLRDVSKGAHLRTDAANCFYPIFVRDGIIVGFGDVSDDEYHPGSRNVVQEDGTIAVYPIDGAGEERKWAFARKTVDGIREDLAAKWNAKNGLWDIIRTKYKFNYKTVWSGKRYSANSHGTVRLRRLLPGTKFTFPKSIFTVRDSIDAALGNRMHGWVVDYFAGSGTTGHAVINLNREDGGRRRFILVEMGDHFDTDLMPRLKKVAFSPEWKDGVAERTATAEESERGPRIIKYFRLESYEDALNNIEFEEVEESLFELEDYLLRYMLEWETKGSSTFLNVAALERPFDYKLRLGGNGDGSERAVDVAETFNYLLGLAVRTRRTYDDDGRRYLVYAGETRDRRSAVVIWRNTDGWTAEDRERDRDFVARHEMTAGADEVWMNGDSMVEDARPLEKLFKQRMFAPVSG